MVPEITDRSFKYREYVASMGEGVILARKDFADHFGVSYSTALYHLEKAVRLGLLNKQYGVIEQQAGWLYALPSTMPRLGGF